MGAQYRDLRRGCSNWELVVSPGLKPTRRQVPNRSGFCRSFWKENLGDENGSKSLVTWPKWSNDGMKAISFSATSFYNPCTVFYFSLILPLYMKRKITNVDNVIWTTTFNAHLLMSFFKEIIKVSLSALCTIKTESGYNTCCILFFSAMISARAKLTNLITLFRQGYKIHNKFSETCYWLVNGDSKKKVFVQVNPII